MIIACTAHRPSGLTNNKTLMYNNTLTNALADFFLHYLKQYRPERAIAGGALGGDTGFAVATLRFGVPLTVAVPFFGQESKWGEAAKSLYYRILDRADEVVYVEQGSYAAWKMQHRNEWMVDQADMILSIWSGKSGGTANCIAYAETQGKQVVNLWDEWVKFRIQYKL